MSLKINQNHAVLFILVLVVLYFVYKNYSEHMDNTSESEQIRTQETTSETESENKNKPTIGVYYTEWCGHSQRLLEKLNNGLLNDLQNANIDVKLVDCEKDTQTCASLNIQGYPTILLYKNNKITQYNGPREKNQLLDFVNNN